MLLTMKSIFTLLKRKFQNITDPDKEWKDAYIDSIPNKWLGVLFIKQWQKLTNQETARNSVASHFATQ